MITHIVFFKLEDAAPEDAEKLKSMLSAMQGRIPQLRHLEVGVDVLRSERSYDLALVSKFDSLEDLEAYRVHPVHQKVVEFLKSLGVATVAVDYESAPSGAEP